jgi:hypothetical protein
MKYGKLLLERMKCEDPSPDGGTLGRAGRVAKTAYDIFFLPKADTDAVYPFRVVKDGNEALLYDELKSEPFASIRFDELGQLHDVVRGLTLVNPVDVYADILKLSGSSEPFYGAHIMLTEADADSLQRKYVGLIEVKSRDGKNGS